MKRNVTHSDVLIEERADAITSLDALMDGCLQILTTRLWQTCCWPNFPTSRADIGDFRFLVVEFCPTEDVSLYVQFWSDPHEPVLIEVCSGNWNPEALKYVWHEQRARLEARGFTIGGAARNFQKRLTITSPDEAEAAAKEALAILFEVF